MKHYCDPQGFKGWLKERRKRGKDFFFTAFDGPRKGTNEVFKQGEAIFASAFQPWLDKYNVQKGVSLDIGYGSGAYVFTAAKQFQLAMGVDIHDEQDLVEKELKERGCMKFKLYTGDGWIIPHLESDIDFIHSFVTISHFISIEVVRSYLAECFRVLRNGGIAVLYFGKLVGGQDWKGGIQKEKKNPVGWKNRGDTIGVNKYRLTIAMWKMEKMARQAGFELLDRTSTFKAKNGVHLYCGQHGVILRKMLV